MSRDALLGHVLFEQLLINSYTGNHLKLQNREIFMIFTDFTMVWHVLWNKNDY